MRRTARGQLLSVVIPAWNEVDALTALRHALETVAEKLPVAMEWIIVDDGSTDGTADALLQWHEEDARCRPLLLAGNHGKELALLAGLDASRGDYVACMDADLQDPPDLLGKMLELARNGADVVVTQYRTVGGVGWIKKSTAYLFYRAFALVFDGDRSVVVDANDFRLYRRDVVDHLRNCRDRNPFIRARSLEAGYRLAVLKYDRASRVAGTTKYPMRRMIGLAITAFLAAGNITRLVSLLAFVSAAGIGFTVAIAFLMMAPTLNYLHGILATMLVGCAIVFGVVVAVCVRLIGRLGDQVSHREAYTLSERSPEALAVPERSPDVLPLRRRR